MRVLIICPTFAPDVGGAETLLTGLCSYLERQGYTTNVITYSPLMVKVKAPFKEQLYEHVTIWRIPWIGHGLFNVFERYAPLQFLYLVPGLLIGALIFLLMARPRPDVMHVFGLSGAFVGGLLSKVFLIPCVAEMCAIYRLAERSLLARLVKMVLDWSDYVCGNMETGKRELINIGLNPEKVGIMEPPVDETVFKPIPQSIARTKIGLPEEGFVALFVGRMVEGKGVEVAVKATKLVDRSVTFVFVGEGPLRYLVDDAAAIDLRIRPVNNVAHHDLAYYYNAADVLMCAPVETIGTVAFVGREALMCGLPILVPNKAIYHGISTNVTASFPTEVARLQEQNPQELAEILINMSDVKTFCLDPLFDRQKCFQFGIENYSSKSLDWLKDSYQKVFQKRRSFSIHNGS